MKKKVENSLEGWSQIIRDLGEQDRQKRSKLPKPIIFIWAPFPNKVPLVRIQAHLDTEGLPTFNVTVLENLSKANLIAFANFVKNMFEP